MRKTFAALFALMLACAPSGKAQPYENLVLEGGGIRGIAYAGALEVLEENGLTGGIRRVAGTSVGGIVATLFALGYSAADLRALLAELRINTFNDGRWIFFGGQHRLRTRYGWYRGDRLEEWVGRQIAARTGNANTTFAQLRTLAATDRRFRELYLTGTDLSAQTAVVFDADHFPDMPIRTAVRVSVSIPVYFSAVVLDSAGQRAADTRRCPACHVFVDGGVLLNYPLGLFDSVQGTAAIPNMRTLGLKLERNDQMALNEQDGHIAPFRVRGITDYVGALYNLCMEQLNRRAPFSSEQSRTVYINTSDISPRVRRVSTAQKEKLYNNGAAGALRVLEKQRSAD